MGVDKDLRVLTQGERCRIWRRKSGLSQTDFGGLYFLTRDDISDFEKRKEPVTETTFKHNGSYPWRRMRPSLGDLCQVARRRSGKRLTECGVSSTITTRREQGDRAFVLKEIWEKEGFIFPEGKAYNLK